MEGSIWIEREGELEGKEGEGQARGHWEWRGGRKGNKERAKQGVTGSGEGELEGKELLTEYCNAYLMRM